MDSLRSTDHTLVVYYTKLLTMWIVVFQFGSKMIRLAPLTVFVLVLCLDRTISYRRDYRFLKSYCKEPSAAFTSLMGTYATDGKYFGNIIQHVNSDGSKTPQIVLNNKQGLPLVGFGTWQLGGNASSVKDTIKQAIDAGYRLIDTAYIYDTEEPIGDVLQELFSSGKLKREDIFVTTKVWTTYFSKIRVLQSIRESLKKLKLNYVDLILLHFPTGFKDGKENFPKFKNGTIIPRTWRKDAYLEAWNAMENAVQLGLVSSIGVSNFNRNQMKKLLKSAKIKPVLNQVNFTVK